MERLRNKDGLDEIRIYRMEEISFAFRPYYKVELGLAERQSAPPSAVTTAALAEPPAPDPVVDAESEDHVDVLPRRTEVTVESLTTEAVAELPAAPACARPGGRDRRCQRPSGAVRPLSARPARGGSSQRVVEQRREREGRKTDHRGRGRAQHRGQDQDAEGGAEA